MAYIGQDIEGGVLAKQTLAANGVLTSFELDHFSDANGLIVSVQGVVQEPGVAYTVSGKTITFTTAPAATTYVVFIEKELTVTSLKPLDYIDYQTGTADGSATPLTLSHSTSDPEDIMVTLNGITQRPVTDYTVSGTTLTFTTAPTNGMVITVYHLNLRRAEGTVLDGTVTDDKIVSMSASKLTGSLPSSMIVNLSKQFRAMSAIALHWASVENKVAMNLQQDFLDHFQDDTGWVAYNGVAGVPALGDASSSAHTVTASGNAAASTTEKKIGTHSIAFDGTGDYLTIPDHNDFKFDGDYTIECWFYTGSSSGGCFFSKHQSGVANIGLFINRTTAGKIRWQDDKNSIYTEVGSGLNNSAWHHLALVRSGTASNNLKLYIDGTLASTQSGSTAQTQTSDVAIGYYINNNDNYLDGYIDEHRVSNVARYTANFTPQTTAFSSDANTLLLIHGEAQAAVPNTGSENVGRDTTDEYMSTTTEVAGSTTDWPYTNFADQVFSVSAGAFGDINSYNNSNNTHTIAKNTDNNYLAWTTAPTNWTHSMMVDYKAAYTWSGIKIGFQNTYAMIKTWRLEYSDDGTNWTIMDQTGSTSASLAGYNLAIDNNVSITTDATGVITNVTNGGNNHKHGAHITFGTPVTARHLKISVGSHVANSDSAAGLDFFIPLYTPKTITFNTTGKVVSTSQTAEATVSKTTGVMLYDDGTINTSTVGTDLKTYFSSDDGANWTEAASYGNPVTFAGTTKLIPLGETTLSGGTGTAVKMKAEFANQMGASSDANTASVITPHGDVKHSTALSTSVGKFPPNAINFPGVGSYSGGSLNRGTEIYTPHDDIFDHTGDFTWEFWFNTTDTGNGKYLMSRHQPAGYTMKIALDTAGALGIGDQAHGDWTANLATGLNDGEWHHVAWCRSGSTIKIFVDGSQVHSYTGSNQMFGAGNSSPVYIGSYANQAWWQGKMEEIRISDNARYTTNFTPHTSPHVSDSNTLLLIQSGSGDSGSTFTDSSSYGRTILTTTWDGQTPSHFDTLPPVGSSSISFGGNANTPRLTIPNEGNPLGISGYDDFTIEGWFLWDGTGTNYARLFNLNFGTTAGSEAINLDYYSPSNTLRAHASTNGGSRNILNSNNTEHGITANTWFHVAMVRSLRADASTSDIKVYVDGKQRNWYFSTSAIGGSETGATFAFGGYGLTGGAATEFWYGHMDELRISNMARYTGEFTPTKTKFVKDNQTTLLIHADQPNNSVTFTSDEVKSNLIQPIGDAKHSNYAAKFGNSGIDLTSAAGQGGSEYLTVPHSDDWRPNNNGVLTLECWIKPTAASQPNGFNNTILSYYEPDGWMIEMNQDKTLRWRAPKSAGFATYHLLDSAAPLPLNQWSHLAVVMDRVNDMDYLYLNGVLEGSGANNFDHAVTSDPLFIGRYTTVNDSGMVGYLDEIRISNVARYTGATYTEPTAAFTSDANTLLLIHSDEADGSTTFTDSSSHARTITRVGASHEGTQKKIGTSAVDFDGASQLEIPGRSDFVVSNTDTATIEFWFKLTETTGQYTFMGGDEWTGGSPYPTERSWMIDAGGSSGGNYIRWTHHSHTVQTSWTADTSWHHLAVAIDSGTQKVYLDGTLIVTGNRTGQWGNAAGSKLIIGNGAVSGSGYSQAMHGYIDELRWSNVVRYTANFTPSTSAFTTDGNTLLLLHGDGSGNLGNLITDDSYTTGKQTQLHGWAVNY